MRHWKRRWEIIERQERRGGEIIEKLREKEAVLAAMVDYVHGMSMYETQVAPVVPGV